jgi:uncharacterized surface protein with fasciclin (FAS1) repeats
MAEQVVELDAAGTVNGQRLSIEVREGKVYVAGSKVVSTDIKASNGVIHVIDSVMLPASDDIVQTAANAGTFKTLAAALTSAELAATLQGEGPFTVFAPTDEAFAKLPKGTVETLLKPENREQLVSILTYHVVSGRVYSPEALKAGKAGTLQGQDVTIRMADGKARVNDAGLVSTDIQASNGVIHVIDTVLMPKG